LFTKFLATGSVLWLKSAQKSRLIPGLRPRPTWKLTGATSPYNTITNCFQNHQFLGKQYNFFDQMKEVIILQGSAVTFFRFGGTIHYHVRKIS